MIFYPLARLAAQTNAGDTNTVPAGSGQFSGTARPVPPPEPAVRPLIAENYPEDSDGDRIADTLMDDVAMLQTIAFTSTLGPERAQAELELEEAVDVELIFNSRIAEEQVNRFIEMGGEITHVYRSVSYGWNGRIPRSELGALPASMGNSLVFVTAPVRTQLHLDKATQAGRVRPVWAPGFAELPGGVSGDATITIAILDSGLDGSHSDLSGREAFWHDYTPDAEATPVDMGGHGSHVAGIAVGSGAAGGMATGTLLVTQEGDLSTVGAGSFFPAPFDLPAAGVTWNSIAQWTGGGSTTYYQVRHPRGSSGGWVAFAGNTGTSPLTVNSSFTADASLAYSPALLSAGSSVVGDFVITSQVTGYPGVGDGFNTFRGVAPGCNWAGAKVFQNSGAGSTAWTDAALDDLVANRVANNIKVMNLSFGVIGNPGLSASMRQKVNTAVNNGIVVVCSAGNDGGSSSVDDPGRAAMALTVAAANDTNRLTSYTSRGFLSPGSVPGQEEDFKPDLMAPGGSVSYHTAILAVDSNDADGPSFADQQGNDYIGFQGTSMASPFAAGCAALVIDAMQQNGTSWNFNSSEHSRFVKMILCATATESNADRESASQNPSLQRDAAGPEGFPAGKDRYEGYGMLNADAAVEAVSTTLSGLASGTLGGGATDRRAWATRVDLVAGQAFEADLAVPGTGDFDLYLYHTSPSAYGTPVRLAFSTGAGDGVAETISYTSSSNAAAILVVKRVSGSGTFELTTPVSITGIVAYHSPSGPPTKTVGDVTMNLVGDAGSSTLTLGDGSFGFVDLTGGGTYGIAPAKTNDSTVANGVTTLDIALIRQHILSPSVSSLTTPYKLLAADVNGSGGITTLDIALIRQLILGGSTKFPAGLWRFVPAGYVFPNTNAPWNAPTNNWHTNLVADVTGEDFIAIKLGDVNASWTMPVEQSSVASSDTLKAASLKSSIRFHAGSSLARHGEIVRVPVTVSGFRDVTTAQLTLEWAAKVLTFVGVEQYGLSGLSAANFGTSRTEDGKLTFSWYDPAAQGATVSDGTAIFMVTFEVTGKSGEVSPVALTDSPTLREASVNLALATVATEDGLVSVIAPEDLRVSGGALEDGVFQLSLPTVSGRQYVLEFTDELPGTNWTELQLIDGDGTVRVLVDFSATNHQRFYRVRAN